MRIAYLVHDLSDPAVGRRVAMLTAGGAEVILLGFRRGEARGGLPAVELGRTRDGRLVGRAGSVLRALATAPAWSRTLAGVEAIVARNLEMLVLASAARALAARKAALTYEVLDVHRTMLGDGVVSAALRGIERGAMRGASRLIVSSPAFVSAYFEPRGQAPPPALIVENKVLCLEGPPARPGPRAAGPPWRIGWYGMIRCQRSLDILTRLARGGLVEVEIRGRAAYTAFRDFDAQVAAAPGVNFQGPYDPAQLAALYGGVHFAWAIDYFEAGLNSDWLLPNRLYEGQLHGAVAIALRGVETGRWLAARGAGLLLDDAERDLGPAFAELTPASYAELARRTAAVPTADLVCDRGECEALVRALRAPAS